MSPMHTAEGQPLPEPHYRETHRYGFFKSSEGRQVEVVVREVRHPGLAILTVTQETPGWECLTLEYLTGLAALRQAEGHRLLSASTRQIILAPPAERSLSPNAKPVCARCGSDRVVRDACARWDTGAGAWTLADVHDCAFCEACEAEGDDLIRSEPPVDASKSGAGEAVQ